MKHYGGKELAEGFRTVRKNTIQIAEDIPESKYSFRATTDVRSVGELLSHIAVSHGFQHQIHGKDRRSTLEGFDFMALMARLTQEEKTPRSKEQTIALLKSSGKEFSDFLESLSDDFLAERVAMPPGAPQASRSRFDMLLSVKEHEMHHRGQLMLIQRMNGIVPHLTREMQARFARAANTPAATRS